MTNRPSGSYALIPAPTSITLHRSPMAACTGGPARGSVAAGCVLDADPATHRSHFARMSL
jgi:hypothetical protein